MNTSTMELVAQINQNGVGLYSQGRVRDAKVCFRHALSILKIGIQRRHPQSGKGGIATQNPSIPRGMSVPSPMTSKTAVSYYADGLLLQPVTMDASLLARTDERSIVVTSAVAVFNLAITHHAASLQSNCSEADTHFFMTSALKLYELVQSLQEQAGSHPEDAKAQGGERFFLLENMMRLTLLHNAGVLLTKLNRPQDARSIFEHLYQVVLSLGLTPRDFDASKGFDLNVVIARVLLEMNVLNVGHTAPCA